MSRAELDLLDRHAALVRERLRATVARTAEDARVALDPSPLIRAHPEASVVSAFAFAWVAGRGMRTRRPPTVPIAAAVVPEKAARVSSRGSPLRPVLVLMRFARTTARQWVVGRIVELWSERKQVERPTEPRVA